ncbi:uncharacterized protein K02A2.6-like [Aedes albopictus]|uniref:Peptidase A2 domain-containing protein n=1 Tax=Aedes albopictus TaxID=7160 RepID=A0ABM1ZMM0_AEDAL
MFSPPGGDRPGSVPPANGLQQHPAVPNHQPGVSFQPQQPPSVPVINPPPFLQTSGSQAGSYVPQQQQQNVSSVDPVTLQLFQQMQQQINLQFQQQQAFLTQQLDVFRTAMSAIQVSVPTNPEQILDSLASNIREFRYEPDQNVTFGGWFVRYEDLFAKDAVRLDDEAKVRLLLRKLGPSEHERYTSYILPKSPNAIRFDDTVSKLKSLFGTPESVISRRYRCLRVKKQATEDYKMFACRVNKLCVEFELGKLSEDQFKCLMFVCGLKAESDAEIRTRLLSRIEERDDVTLEQISDECQRLLNIKHDTAMIESASSSAAVQSLKKQDGKKNYRSERGSAESRSSPQKGARPTTPCWNCGAMHYSRDCPFKNNRCKECGQTGHKDGYCSSAKKIKSPSKRYTGKPANIRSVQVKNIRKRRRFVKAEVNGRQVSLQLDTASDISIISEQTWQKIGQPASTPATVQAATASGKPLKLQFQCCCEIIIKGEKRTGQFYVVPQQLNLLGLDLIDAFNLGSMPMDQFCNQAQNTNHHQGARSFRKHINQLRCRAGAYNTPKPSTIPFKAGKHQLPLDILLQACNLHQPSHAQSARHSPSRSPSLPTLAPSVPMAQMPSTLAAPSVHSTPLQATPAQPSLVWVSPTTTETRGSSSVSASTSRFPSSSATSFAETETAGSLPRRSSRQRRPPIRFDPYQLYKEGRCWNHWINLVVNRSLPPPTLLCSLVAA